MRRALALGLASAALACLIAAPRPAAANSSSPQTTTVRFATGPTGYASASVGMTYVMLNCMGELHVAYRIEGASVRAGPEYLIDGKSYGGKAGPATVSAIRMTGTVHRGPELVGTFGDSAAGDALGMGCFSGQIQKVGVMSRWLGDKPTPEQVRNFLNSLTVRAQSSEVLRNSAIESEVRAEAKRVADEAEAARQREIAAKRKAEEDAQKKAQAEQQKQEQDRARTEAQAAGQGQQAAGGVGAGGGAGAGAGGVSLPPAPPPLTAAQRSDLAIQQDRILAEQRLAEQRRVYAEQQAQAEAARRRQDAALNQAIISAAPALGNAIDSWIDAADARKAAGIAARYQAMMSTKKCWDENKRPVVTSEIKLGVQINTSIDEADCGNQSTFRWERYAFVAKEPMKVRVTARRAGRNTPWVAFFENTKRIAYGEPCGPIWCASAEVVVTINSPGVYWIDTGNYYGESGDYIRGFGGMNLIVERIDPR